MPQHDVQQGDCIESIAYEHGFTPESIWEFADNTDLREARDNQRTLLPGDVVHVPEREQGEHTGAVDARHRFRRKGVPAMLRLRLLKGGQPRSNLEYRLTIDGIAHDGTTDDQGRLEVRIPPNARRADLRLAPGSIEQENIPIALGGVDPISEVTGVQGRLRNLGFPVGELGELDEQTQAAIADFQRAHGLEETGDMDQDTRQELQDSHES